MTQRPQTCSCLTGYNEENNISDESKNKQRSMITTRCHTPTLTGVLGRNSRGTEDSALSRRDTKEFAACRGSVGYALKPGFS